MTEFNPNNIDGSKPAVQVLEEIRQQFEALGEGIVAHVLVGWSETITRDTDGKVSAITYKKNTLSITETLARDGDGLIASTAFTADYKGQTKTIGTLSYTRDSGGKITSTTWS